MSMWEPFTPQARDAMVQAQKVAEKHGDSFISHHHIFIAISDAPDVAQILAAMGVERDRMQKAGEKALGEEGFAPTTEMTFTADAKRMIELAFENARRLDNNFIGAEHMALGYIDLGPKHLQILSELEIDVQKFRALLIASLEKKPKRRAETPPPGKAAFESICRKAGNFEGRRSREDLWQLVQSAAEQKDLASVLVHALAIAVRESITADELLRHIEIRLGE